MLVYNGYMDKCADIFKKIGFIVFQFNKTEKKVVNYEFKIYISKKINLRML